MTGNEGMKLSVCMTHTLQSKLLFCFGYSSWFPQICHGQDVKVRQWEENVPVLHVCSLTARKQCLQCLMVQKKPSESHYLLHVETAVLWVHKMARRANKQWPFIKHLVPESTPEWGNWFDLLWKNCPEHQINKQLPVDSHIRKNLLCHTQTAAWRTHHPWAQSSYQCVGWTQRCILSAV